MKKHSFLTLFIYTLIFLINIQYCRAQPKLWGMTSSGGADNIGVIFKTDTVSNSETVTHSFTKSAYGGIPQNMALIQATNGMLYGMASSGGINDMGVIFEFNPNTNVYTKKIDFTGTNGQSPYGSLIQATDGMLYGMTYQGGSSGGTIIQYNTTTNICTKKFSFVGNTTGAYPQGSLIQASDGMLYGITTSGGNNNKGALFQFNPSSSAFVKKIDLSTSSGAIGTGSLIQATDGMIYGMTNQGGNSNLGTIFQYNPTTSTYTKKIDLTSGTGATPFGSLVEGNNGLLYGLTSSGGANNAGTLFQYNPATNTFTKLLDLNEAQGSVPKGSLMLGSGGSLFGLTSKGGVNGKGVMFNYAINTNTYSTLHHFNTTIGAYPNGSILKASNGMLYGSTSLGGANGAGILFKFDPSSTLITNVFNFNINDGSIPFGSLMLATDGMMYGMTTYGGTFGNIFQIDPSTNIYTQKFVFDGSESGQYPKGALVEASDGKLYGMTQQGGFYNSGVLFQFDPTTNTFTKKFDFDVNNGSSPDGTLIEASDGKLYGLTLQGGANGVGVLFQYDPATDIFVKKFDFDQSTGSFPSGKLVQASDNNLYGITQQGGSAYGTLFQYSILTENFTKKISFNPLSGGVPNGSLVEALDGKLYGTTQVGNSLFQYDIASNSCSKKVDFTSIGTSSYSPLTLASDGMLYGMTSMGGLNNVGTIFQYNPTTNNCVKKTDFNGANGQYPNATNLIDITNAIATHQINSTNCAGSHITVPFGGSGAFNNGNIFTAQLSDANGSFASPTHIGTLTSSALTGAIQAIIPTNTPLGSSYRIRVVSNTPAITGRDNGSNITINAALNITATASPSDAVCAGDSVALNGSGANTYTWSGNITNGVHFIPSSTLTYTLTAVDGNGCASSITKTIQVNELPTVFAHVSATTVCSGHSVILTGIGSATSYSWTDGVTDGIPFIPVDTIFVVTGTADNGCIGTATKKITIAASPTVIASSNTDTICAGSGVILTASGTGAIYSWSGGITDGQSFTPLTSTTYTLTGTSGNGCTNQTTKTITVNQPPLVFAIASATVTCANENVTLSGVGNATSYSWTGGITDGVPFSATITNTYTVTGTDLNNCTGSANKTITVLQTSASSQSPFICSGEAFTVGSNNYTQSGTYTDILVAANGCDSLITTNLTVNDVSVSASSSVLTANASTANYQWLDCNNGYSVISGETAQNYSATGTGSYAVQIVQNTCIDTSDCYITTTSIIENYGNLTLNIYPNPFNEQTTISFSKEQQNITIKITDILGKQISTILFSGKKFILEKGEMSAGIYFIDIQTQHGSVTKKIVVN